MDLKFIRKHLSGGAFPGLNARMVIFDLGNVVIDYVYANSLSRRVIIIAAVYTIVIKLCPVKQCSAFEIGFVRQLYLYVDRLSVNVKQQVKVTGFRAAMIGNVLSGEMRQRLYTSHRNVQQIRYKPGHRLCVIFIPKNFFERRIIFQRYIRQFFLFLLHKAASLNIPKYRQAFKQRDKKLWSHNAKLIQ